MLSHQDLAYLAFSTRETVTKSLGDLALQGILELGYRRIVVIDLEALRRAAYGK
jgi:CRP-like cAMP-binding protein